MSRPTALLAHATARFPRNSGNKQSIGMSFLGTERSATALL